MIIIKLRISEIQNLKNKTSENFSEVFYGNVAKNGW